jgi:hypothetical protein
MKRRGSRNQDANYPQITTQRITGGVQLRLRVRMSSRMPCIPLESRIYSCASERAVDVQSSTRPTCLECYNEAYSSNPAPIANKSRGILHRRNYYRGVGCCYSTRAKVLQCHGRVAFGSTASRPIARPSRTALPSKLKDRIASCTRYTPF